MSVAGCMQQATGGLLRQKGGLHPLSKGLGEKPLADLVG